MPPDVYGSRAYLLGGESPCEEMFFKVYLSKLGCSDHSDEIDMDCESGTI